MGEYMGKCLCRNSLIKIKMQKSKIHALPAGRQIKIQKEVKLSLLSTFGIGGKAGEYIKVSGPREIVEVISFLDQEGKKYSLFAGGSNVVFGDEGIDGTAVQIKGGKYAGNMREMVADSGMDLSDAINEGMKKGLSGLESLSGIPGTVGGAVVGNAGAYGHSISEVVEGVEVLEGSKSREGRMSRRWMSREECRFDYRESIFKKEKFIVLRVLLKFKEGSREELEKISREIIKLRTAKYHPGLKCPGSFFKNVLVRDVGEEVLERVDQDVIIDGKIPAGYLLSEVGAKGMREGGIEIASYHGNLFINRGGGKAADVRKLAGILKEKVMERFGIKLVEEIRYF